MHSPLDFVEIKLLTHVADILRSFYHWISSSGCFSPNLYSKILSNCVRISKNSNDFLLFSPFLRTFLNTQYQITSEKFSPNCFSSKITNQFNLQFNKFSVIHFVFRTKITKLPTAKQNISTTQKKL